MIPDDLRHLRAAMDARESLAAIAEIILGIVGGAGLVYGVAMLAIWLAR